MPHHNKKSNTIVLFFGHVHGKTMVFFVPWDMNILIILIPSKYSEYQTAVIINFTDAPVKNKQSYLAKSCIFLMHSNFTALQHVSISYIQTHYSGTASVLKKLN